MKTVMIYEEFDDLAKFYVFDGDYRVFDGLILNQDDERDTSFNAYFFDDETGQKLHQEISKEQFIEEIKNGAALIQVAFAP